MQSRLWARIGDMNGQATLEYGLILFSFLAVIVAFAAIWTATKDGALSDLAISAGSHLVSGGTLETIQDVILY